MANIKINLTNNTQDSLTNQLGMVGRFQRSFEEAKKVTTVEQLDKYFGTQQTPDYVRAKSLLDENVPLLVKGVLSDNDDFSSTTFGTAPITETATAIYSNSKEELIDSFTLDDGVYNITQGGFDSFNATQIQDTNFNPYQIWWQSGNSRQNDLIILRITLTDFWNMALASVNLPNGGLTGMKVAFSRFVQSSGSAIFPGLENEIFTFNNISSGYNSSAGQTVVNLFLRWDNATFTNGIRDYAAIGQYSFSTNCEVDLYYPTFTTLEVVTSSISINAFQVGDTIQFTSADEFSNENKDLTIDTISSAGSVITLGCTSPFSFVSDPNTSGNGQIIYRDRTVQNTLTILGDWSPLFNTILSVGSVSIQVDSLAVQNIAVNNVALNGNNDTVFTIAQVPTLGTVNSLYVPLAATNTSILEFAAPPAQAINTSQSYGLSLDGGLTSVNIVVDSIYTVQGSSFYVLSAPVAVPAAYSTIDVYLASTGGGNIMTTNTKGANVDISFTVTKKVSGYDVKVFVNQAVVESWVLFNGFDQQDVDDFNEGMELVNLYIDVFGSLPTFFSHAFSNQSSSPTQQDFITNYESFDLIPIPALYGDLNIPLSTYDYKFPKTIFMNIPDSYTLTQAQALAGQYNNSTGRNVVFSYGQFNGVDLSVYAIRAFYQTELNGDAFTQLPYGNLGRINKHKNNTVLKPSDISDLDNAGIVAMDSLNGSYSDYRLTNNTTPYRKVPLERANVNFILNRLIWEVHQIEFINKDKVLNIALFGVINSQFTQLLANYEEYLETAEVIDDSGAADLDSLVVNNKADVLAGNYKVILELKFYNTLKTLSIEFNIA